MSGPDRIWLTHEDTAASWSGAFTAYRASSLDHGADCPEYIRRDPAVIAALPEVQAIVADAVKAEREALEQARATNRRFQRRIQLLEGWWQRRVERANNAMSNYFALWLMEAKGRAPSLKAIEEAAYQRGYDEGLSEHSAHITRRGHILSMPAAIRKRGEEIA